MFFQGLEHDRKKLLFGMIWVYFQIHRVLCCGGMSQRQLVPFLLLPPIPNVPEGGLPSKDEFIQLLWHQCDGDLTGFQGKLN